MRSICLKTDESSPGLVASELPLPEPGPGELLIRVRAAGTTTAELSWYPTLHNKDGSLRTLPVPAHEFSGQVVAVGPGTSGFSIGDEVFGMNDWFANGALAEYALATPSSVTHRPRELTPDQAAAVPISILTAWQGLFAHADLKRGERLLLQGAAGAVGLYALQLAHAAGAQIFCTASGADAPLLRKMGADEVIDYRQQPFESVVKDVDVVFDCVGGKTLARSWNVLAPGGRLVTVASDAEGTSDARAKAAFFIVEQNGTELTELSSRLTTGELKVFVGAIVPLEKAPDAYSGTVARTGPGKIVVHVADFPESETANEQEPIN